MARTPRAWQLISVIFLTAIPARDLPYPVAATEGEDKLCSAIKASTILFAVSAGAVLACSSFIAIIAPSGLIKTPFAEVEPRSSPMRQRESVSFAIYRILHFGIVLLCRTAENQEFGV